MNKLNKFVNAKLLGLKEFILEEYNTENICKKIYGGISAIRRDKAKAYVNKKLFDSCCEVWDVFGETQSQALQKLQKRAARIILNMKRIQIKRKRAKGKMMYKVLNKMGPRSLTKLFLYKSE